MEFNSTRKEFFEYCKDNRKNKELIEEKAHSLWIMYKPEKLKQYDNCLKHHVDLKKSALENSDLGLYTRRKVTGIQKLALKNPVSKPLFIVNILTFLALIALIIVSINNANDFSTLIIEICVIVAVILIVITELNRTKYYRKIEVKDQDIREKAKSTKDSLVGMNSRDKYANKYVRFQNGKYKKGKYKEELTEQYRIYVISTMQNPYKADSRKQQIDSESFRSSGGIYAWWYQGKVVYIGKTNNFSKRMKQHSKGLIGDGNYSEKKYNSELDISRVSVQILAETDDENEQSVLESFSYERYNKPYLNSCVPLKFEKILTKKKYSDAWLRIKDKVQ